MERGCICYLHHDFNCISISFFVHKSNPAYDVETVSALRANIFGNGNSLLSAFLAILPFSREGSFHTTLDYMCKKPLPVCCSMRCFNAYNIRCTGFIDLFFGVIVFFLWNFRSNFCHTATVIEFASFHSSLVWILLFEFINQDDSRTWHHRFVYQKYFDDFVYIHEIARLIPSSSEFLKCMYQKNLFFGCFLLIYFINRRHIFFTFLPSPQFFTIKYRKIGRNLKIVWIKKSKKSASKQD